MERQEFEDSLKRAFEGAEVTPSENVWVGVELDLEKERTKRLKKRVVYYQLLAAASIMFAIGLSVNTYFVDDSQLGARTQIAENTSSANSPSKSNGAVDKVPENASRGATLDQNEGKNSRIRTRDKNNAAFSIEESGKSASDEILSVGNDANFQHEYYSNIVDLNKQTLPPLTGDLRPAIPQRTTGSEQVDPVAMMLAKLDQREKQIRDDEDDQKNDSNGEKLWTSLGFAAGSFTAVNAGVDPSPANAAIAMNTPQVNEEVKASGMSYSMGINLGTRISERWVLQGGVNYLTQLSEYTAYNAVRTTSPVTNFTSFKPPTVGQVQHLNDAETEMKTESLVATAPYNVNNSIRYLTIPLQAGYMVVNRDFGLQLNAGVASDLFLQNTVSAEGDDIDESRQTPGGDTPYRSINFSGLVGTEFSYKFGERYRISLNPGVRYPFNSIYKSNLDVKASPLTFDVGLRFRYIFR